MFQKIKHDVCLWLAVALLLSLLPALPIFAADSFTAYFRNDAGWSEITLQYADSDGKLTTVPMTFEKVDYYSGYQIYAAEYPGSATSIQFFGVDADGNAVQSEIVTDIQLGVCYYFQDGKLYTQYYEPDVEEYNPSSYSSCPHDYEVIAEIPADCTRMGYTIYRCSLCAEVYQDNYVDPLGHTPDDTPVVTIAATCTQPGGDQYICARCDISYLENAVEPLGHTPVEGSGVPTVATCDEDGYTTYTCATCSDSYIDDIIKSSGHAVDDQGKCSNCDNVLLVVQMVDQYGDGWNGNGIWVHVNGEFREEITVTSGKSYTWAIAFDPANTYQFYWKIGSWPSECSFTISVDGTVQFTSGGCADYSTDELLYTHESICNHSFTSEVIAPSCTQEGYTAHTCSKCGYSYASDEKPTIAHSYGTGKTCAVCGAPKSIEIVMHESAEDTWNNAAVLIYANGELKGVASIQDGQVSEQVYDIHYDDSKEYTFVWVRGSYPGECSYEIYACGKMVFSADNDDCGSTETGALVYTLESSCNHSFDPEVIKPVTCLEDGYTTKTCKLCGLVRQYDLKEATGHTYNMKGVVSEPTCEAEGYTAYACEDCDHVVKTNIVDALPHTYGENYCCTACGSRMLLTVRMHDTYGDGWNDNALQVYVDDVKLHNATMNGYVRDDTWSVTYDPESAYTFYWTLGSYPEEVSFEILLGNDAVFYSKATCGEMQDGQKVFALNIDCTHTLDEGTVVDPVCGWEGYTHYTCTTCGFTYMDDVVPALEHNFVDGDCTLCGANEPLKQPNISLKYPAVSFKDTIVMDVFFAADNLDNVDDMGLITYSKFNPEYDLDNAENVIAGYTLDSNAGLYYASTQGIAPHNLADTFYFAVYARLTDGTLVYSKMVSYSPLTYAKSIVNGAGFSSEMKTLATAMLNYGAAAQTYFGVEGELMNACLTAEQAAMVAPYSNSMIQDPGTVNNSKVGEFANNGGFSKRYPNITLEGAFSINYFFTPANVPAGDVVLYYWNEADYAAAETLATDNSTGYMIMSGDEELSAAVEGIAAKDLDSTVYVAAIYTDEAGNTWASGVLPYSIGAYCKAQANTATGSMQALAQATAVYAYYAKQLFA